MPTGENIQLNSISQGKEYPIVNAVNKHALEWHWVATEDVHIGRLILSLGVVQHSHHQGPTLDAGVVLLVAEEIQYGQDQYRAQVLNVEHVVPTDLFAQILQSQLTPLFYTH